MPDQRPIDWERLCETPFIKFGHRIAFMLLVPIMLAVGAGFVQMYNTIQRLPDQLDAIDTRQDDFQKRQSDFQKRIRSLEFERRDWR